MRGLTNIKEGDRLRTTSILLNDSVTVPANGSNQISYAIPNLEGYTILDVNVRLNQNFLVTGVALPEGSSIWYITLYNTYSSPITTTVLLSVIYKKI